MNESEGIHPPDWDRFLVTKDGVGAPVGDPIRWGAQVSTPLADTGIQFTNTAQILQVATRDGYSRSWSAIGTLTMPAASWLGNDWDCVLFLTLGVGQIQISQMIPLYLGLSPNPPGGLCVTQHVNSGGPYGSVLAGTLETRSFAIIGGLLGQSFAIRARYAASAFPPTSGWPTTAALSIMVAPYAAGEGL